jgi:hypothetical protein
VNGFTWFNLAPTTNDDLQFDFEYFDYDNDPLDYLNTLILWYKNGLLITGTENQTVLTHDHFVKNDNISVIIRPYDGTNWAASNFSSQAITIVNTSPTAFNVTLTPIVLNGSTVIYLNWTFTDADDDQESDQFIIRWTINGIPSSNYIDYRFIPIEATMNGEQWEATLSVFDGTNYSSDITRSIEAKRLTYEFIFDDPNNRVPQEREDEFYVEDENLVVNFYFSTTNDAFNSRIQWFKRIENDSWTEMGLLENQTTIPYLSTAVGEQWQCLITPFDGNYVWSPINSSMITIESKPIIATQPENIVIANSDIEGHYNFTINTTDERNEISEVHYVLLNDSFSGYASLVNGSEWSLDYQIPKDLFRDYLHSTISGQVRVYSTVSYNGNEFQINTYLNFNFTVEDNAAPRVVNPGWALDDPQNPTNITFSAGVIEYGSDITEVLLYYYFRPFTEDNTSVGIGSSIQETEWRTIKMVFHNTSNDVHTYLITVLFDHNNTNREVIYKIYTTDSAGNSHFAYDIELHDPDRIGETRFNYTTPGIELTLVLLIVGITIIIAIFGSVIYVKFIRKPELVGLDKELVLSKTNDLTDAEIMNSLDVHTIGVVVSFFDQRHGPIPIIIIPEILKDNFTKLVDLSDRSFSGTGFCDDFESEIPSSYDFVLAKGLRTSVMSFGFALNRPEARGGQENLTLNILVHQQLFPLVESFKDEIKSKTHLIHLKMDKNPDEKNQIRSNVFDLRKFVSKIILAYENIYGTTELVVEDK